MILFLADAIFFFTSEDKNNKKFDNCLFMLSFHVFSVFYGLIFALVQPENRRVFGACGILASVQLVLSTAYYFYIFLSTDPNDTQQLLYYTNRLAPISIIYMTVLSVISVLVMCKMSFFRPYTKLITDLYEVEERNGKKAV
ncbi:Protein CBG04781 [Caenorhabditis briggsae]|nr:Protein CBG04781 [Caenorhabditis briggsae]CAP25423.2 Protein CBG04781 [Caenorhabditis briggsae]